MQFPEVEVGRDDEEEDDLFLFLFFCVKRKIWFFFPY